jgi:hypothetical protein
MTTNLPNIDRLRIATPCSISWDQMSGDNRVRFCDHCQLNVYNVSELSKLETQALIAATEGRMCARLYRRVDGTILTKDCPVGLRALRLRISKNAAAVFAVIAGVCGLAFGQNPSSKNHKDSCTSQTKITRQDLAPSEASFVSGNVLDVSGAVVPGAKILLTNLKSNEARTTSTTSEGCFRFDGLNAGNYSLRIESPGFSAHVFEDIVLGISKSLNIDTTLEPAASATIGVVGTADPPLIDTTSSSVTTTISSEQMRRIPIPK